MKISILCTDPNHPIVTKLYTWQEAFLEKGHSVTLAFDKSELLGGDILFLVSCSQLIRGSERQKYKATLVLHASDLPHGRGWSPHVWAILDGKSQVTVSLLEAAEPVDSGAIWLKTSFELQGHELYEEINESLFEAELKLMTQAVEKYGCIEPVEQIGDPGEYMRKRNPVDSRIDPNKTISEQFNLLRVADSQRFPAFFEYRGKKYLIKIEKAKSE